MLTASSLVVTGGAAAAATAPLFLISPTAFDFGAQPLNSPSAQQVVTITNVSGAPITMSGTGGGAGLFGGVQDCQGTTLAANGSCHMYYQFTPTALGAVSGSTGGTWNGQSYTVHFTGTGTPRFAISPTGLDFGQVPVGTTSPQQLVTITNLGSTAITMSGSGGGAGAFGGVQDCQGVSLAAHASCHMYYAFHPTSIGATTVSTGGTWNGQSYTLHFTGTGTGTAAGDYVPLDAQRILDTRTGNGYSGPKPAAGQTITLATGGVVPANAVAADLTVVTTAEAANGSLTVWPCGTARPVAPSVIFGKGVTIANHVNAPLGTNGTVCLRATVGTHVLADLDGYYPATTGYHPVTAARVLDTRNHTGYSGGKPAANKVVELAVTGGAVPTGAAAVALDVTATQEASGGGLTVWPCGAARPVVTAVSYRPSRSVVVLAVSKVGTGGKVCIRTSGSTHLVADLRGWYAGATSFTAVQPERIVDTRSHTGYVGGKPAAGQRTTIKVTGVGAAHIPSNARAVVLDVTPTQESATGYLTLYACGSAVPVAEIVGYPANTTVTDLAVSRIGAGGSVCLRTSKSTHFVVDLVGWYRA